MEFRPARCLLALAMALPAMALAQAGTEPVPEPAAAIPGRADAPPAFAPEGFAVDAAIEADFNRDGATDSAFTLRGDEHRYLVVALGEGKGLRRIGLVALDAWPLGPAMLEVSAKGVLVVTDLTGGTTAIQAVYRYRHDPASDRMRLIGLDLDHYSRTFQHGSMRRSWNYLTGDSVAQDSELGADQELKFGPERRDRQAPRLIYLEDTPDPNDLVSGEG